MKKLIVIAAIIVAIIVAAFTSSAQANDLYAKCENMGKVATAVMQKRQAGVSMDHLLNIAEETGDNGLIRAVIVAAYRYPVEDTGYGRSSAVERFHNEVFFSCLQIIKGK